MFNNTHKTSVLESNADGNGLKVLVEQKCTNLHPKTDNKVKVLDLLWYFDPFSVNRYLKFMRITNALVIWRRTALKTSCASMARPCNLYFIFHVLMLTFQYKFHIF